MGPDDDAELYARTGTDAERAARRELLELLRARGVGEDELRRAVAEDRLAILPVELVLDPPGTLTLAELAARSGGDADQLARSLQALGLGLPGPGDKAFDEDDVEVARALALFRAMGLDEEAMLDTARHLGQSLSTTAMILRQMVAVAVLEEGDSEADFGLRLAEVAERLTPLAGTVVARILHWHLREGVRRDVVTGAERQAGRLEGFERTTVAFADLVGFTRLGQQVDPTALGAVATRLADLTRSVLDPPAVIVKTIGDEVMLAAPRPGPVARTLVRLLERAAQEDGFPPLRAGVADGPALHRGGDWYGATVNLASRIVARARPGSILASESVRSALRDDPELRFSDAGTFDLKGVQGHPRLYRLRPASDSSA